MKRRDALLKGKEGSRRRQRWENGECLLADATLILEMPNARYTPLPHPRE
jgi:hypothetical protein